MLMNVLRTVISVVQWPVVTMYLTVTTVPAIQAIQVMDSTVQVIILSLHVVRQSFCKQKIQKKQVAVSTKKNAHEYYQIAKSDEFYLPQNCNN